MSKYGHGVGLYCKNIEIDDKIEHQILHNEKARLKRCHILQILLHYYTTCESKYWYLENALNLMKLIH